MDFEPNSNSENNFNHDALTMLDEDVKMKSFERRSARNAIDGAKLFKAHIILRKIAYSSIFKSYLINNTKSFNNRRDRPLFQAHPSVYY